MEKFHYLKLLIKNSIIIFSTKVITPITYFILAVSVARILGPSGLGKYSTVLAFYCIFELISFLGIDSLLIRGIAQGTYKVNKILYNITLLGIISTGVCYLVMIIISKIIQYPYDMRVAIALVGIALLPTFVNQLCEAVYIALEKAKYIFYVYLLRETALVLVSLLLLLSGFGLYALIIIIVISRFIGVFLFMLFFKKNNINISFELNFKFITDLLKIISVFMLISIIVNALLEVDVVLLSKMRSMLEVGFYSAIKKIFKMGFIIPFSFVTAISPLLARIYMISKDKFLNLSEILLKYTLAFIIPISITISFLSANIILLFFGKKFIESSTALYIIVWSLIPLSISFLLSRVLISAHQQNKDLLALVIGAITLITAALPLTHRWGYVGMSIAYLFSTTVLAGTHYIFVRIYVARIHIFYWLVRIFVAGITMALFIFFFRGQNLYLITCLSIVIYFCLLIMLKIFSGKDLSTLQVG